MRTGRLAGELAWLVPAAAATGVVSFWAVAKGSKGAEIANSLSFTTGAIGVIVAVLIFRMQERRDGESARAASPLRSRRWAALGGALVLGIGLPLAYWDLIHKPDRNVTDRTVVMSGGTGMREGSRAVVQVPGMPPGRDRLALVLSLTNHAPVGDCVVPASLGLTLSLDGQERDSLTARAGQEVRLDLRGAGHQAQVAVTLTEPDPSCAVDLGVTEAVLYN